MKFLRTIGRPAACIAALGVLTPVYTSLSAQSVINSDGANEALQGLAFWQGNVLLRGWWLAQDNFYFTDAPLYGLIARVQGLGPWVVHEGAGFVYALAVVVAALVARRGALVAVAILALPPALLLQGQMHILGVTYVLAGLLLYERWPDSPWAWGAALVLTAAAMASDPLVTVLFAPAVGGVAALRAWAVPAERRSRLLLVGIMVAGAVATRAVPKLISLLGGFDRPRPLHVGLVDPSALAANLRLAGRGALLVFGADVVGAPHDALAWIHLLGVAAAAAGAGVALWRLRSRAREDFVVQALLAVCALDLAAFVLSSQPFDLASSRFLSPLAVCGAALAGRTLAPHLGPPWRLVPAALAAALLILTVPVQLSRPPAGMPTAGLERWLAARGLSHGLGSYWEASIVTLDTSGRVTVRCVNGPGGGSVRASPDRWFQDSSWFVPGPGREATFVVFSPGEHTANIDEARAIAAFGAPAEIHRVGAYEVLLYSRDLLPELAR